jgi:hypothetical protein
MFVLSCWVDMGDLIDLGDVRADRDEAELKILQLRVEAALSDIGPVTSGPMWLDPDTGDIVLLVEIEMPSIRAT